jgi:hypothetical protein
MGSIHRIGLILAMAFICGCALNPELIKSGSVNTRSDIFKVVSNEEKMSLGYAELTIKAAVKKEKPGDYIFGNNSPDASDRTLLVNIDGQVMSIKGKKREEKNHDIDLRDPEAGVGIRHIFSSKMVIKAGSHHLIIAIPEDNVAVEREIILLEGTANYMLLEPIYRGTAIRKRGQGLLGSTSFHEGLRGFVVKLNGTII